MPAHRPQAGRDPARGISANTRALAAAKAQAYVAWQANGGAKDDPLHETYRCANKATNKASRDDKLAKLRREVKEVQDLWEHHRVHQAFRKANKLAGRRTRAATTSMRRRDGTMAYGADVAGVLKEHFQAVLNVENTVHVPMPPPRDALVAAAALPPMPPPFEPPPPPGHIPTLPSLHAAPVTRLQARAVTANEDVVAAAATCRRYR